MLSPISGMSAVTKAIPNSAAPKSSKISGVFHERMRRRALDARMGLISIPGSPP